MNSSRLFWGLLFLTLGAVFLVQSLFDVTVGFPQMLKFWPVLIILIGISVLLKNKMGKMIISAIAGIFLALLIVSLINRPFHFFDHEITFSGSDVQEIYEPINPKYSRVDFQLSGGAGAFTISASDSFQYELKSPGTNSNFRIDTNTSDSTLYLDVALRDAKIELNSDADGIRNGLMAKLYKGPVYNISAELGAASCNFDFSTLKVNNLHIEMGAASLALKLGMPDSTTSNVNIEMGASSVSISVPKEAGVEIDSEMALSSKNFNGFTNTNGVYRSEGFDSSQKKIFIRVDGGVSSLSVNRY